MRIQLTKARKARKADVLTCVRDDGSNTWMHERPGFALHDLAHYAVEVTFGYRLGFYGLVATGWELSSQSFGRDPVTRQPLPWPDPAVPMEPVEQVVSLLQGELAGRMAPDDFHQALQLSVGQVAPIFSEQRLAAARALVRKLYARWEATPPGGTLELLFPPEER